MYVLCVARDIMKGSKGNRPREKNRVLEKAGYLTPQHVPSRRRKMPGGGFRPKPEETDLGDTVEVIIS